MHVATHGVLNVRSPMFSRLELMRAAGSRASFEDDGRLEVHELLDLTIRSPLVFLSGCETGAGAAWSTSFARGEDYATLAEAFLFAGARHRCFDLVANRGPKRRGVCDGFYKEVGRRPPVEALARAQRALLKDPDTRRHTTGRRTR